MIVDSGGRQVDHDHPGADVAAEMARVLERGRDDPRRQAEIALVGERERRFIILDAHGGGDRAEHLLLVDPHVGIRSEEHTSELQSLMRISYAVFCLTKKKSLKQLETKRLT